MVVQINSTVHLIWNGSNTQRDFHRRLGDGLKEACDLYRDRVKRAISIRVGKVKARGAKKTYRFIIRSKPGEPPRRETANLWRRVKVSIQRSPDLIGTIWHDEEYARYLELGTRHIAPRPAWLPTFLILYRRMIQIIESKF